MKSGWGTCQNQSIDTARARAARSQLEHGDKIITTLLYNTTRQALRPSEVDCSQRE